MNYQNKSEAELIKEIRGLKEEALEGKNKFQTIFDNALDGIDIKTRKTLKYSFST